LDAKQKIDTFNAYFELKEQLEKQLQLLIGETQELLNR